MPAGKKKGKEKKKRETGCAVNPLLQTASSGKRGKERKGGPAQSPLKRKREKREGGCCSLFLPFFPFLRKRNLFVKKGSSLFPGGKREKGDAEAISISFFSLRTGGGEKKEGGKENIKMACRPRVFAPWCFRKGGKKRGGGEVLYAVFRRSARMWFGFGDGR